MKSSSTKSPSLCPWVVTVPATLPSGGGHYLLGPKLVLLHISSQDLDAIDVDDASRATLLHDGFIEEPGAYEAPRRRDSPPLAPTSRHIIAAPDSLEEAAALADALVALDPEHPWTVHHAVPDAPPHGPRGTLLLLGHREAIDPEPIVAPLLSAWNVLWCGEGSDGPHVGPHFDALEQVREYVRASTQWSNHAPLVALGFSQLPLTVTRWIRSDPHAVARAVQHVVARSCGPCVRLEDGSVVVPWSLACRAPMSAESLFETQRWSKGLLRDYTIEQSVDSPLVFFGSCSTPCGADPFLEGNFGKGMSEEEARVTTVGEAVERFAAFVGSRRELPPVGVEVTRHYRLEDFHPFGPGYDAYIESGRPPLPATPIWDEVSRSMVSVPRVLVPVPYRPAADERVPTGSSSTGLAAYSDRAGAILRGALEVLERHNLYRPLLQLEPGQRLDPARLPASGRHRELMRLVGEIERLGFRLWLVRFPSKDGIPIVHAFLWEAAITTMSRGTGSGTHWATAALKATLEALQLRLQHQLVREQGAGTDVDPGYVAWSTPRVGHQLVSHLESFPESTDALPDFLDEAELLGHLKAAQEAILVAELPCPVRGWSVLHVMIPGTTCVCVPSRSAGGQALLDARFGHAIPI